MIQLFQPRGRMVAGLYYKGVLFYTLFIINRLLFLLSCKGCHIIVKRLCSFNKDKIKTVKKCTPTVSGLHENMLITFHCPEKHEPVNAVLLLAAGSWLRHCVVFNHGQLQNDSVNVLF